MTVTRIPAPVAAPAPPKPPQLSLVASALMPDVAVDAFGPGVGPLLASAGWQARRYGSDGGRAGNAKDEWGWERPAGDETLRRMTEHRNALVAAITSMGDLAMQQTEEGAPVDPTSLPTSLFGATVRSRWTGGFVYAPENQYAGALWDPCGSVLDIPAAAVPVLLTCTASTAAGTLTAGTYYYFVTAVTTNGEGLPSSPLHATLASTGEITITWDLTSDLIHSFNVYRGTTATSSAAVNLATVTAPEYEEATAPQTVTYVDNGGATPGSTHPPTSDGTGGTGAYGNLPQVAFFPFQIVVEDECSTFGWEARDFVGRALRLLDNATPAAIEREFWLGNFSQAIASTIPTDLPGANAFLTQSSTASSGGTGLAATDLTPASPPSITRGIQILEDYLANTGFGGQGMIHVAPETSPNLLGARRVGALLLSVMDNIIVPGSGYPTSGATGPAGNANANPGTGNAWIFATDLVSVRLDEPWVFPTSMAEATDRGLGGQPNLTRIRASRFGAATFDGARLGAVRVSLAT